MSEQTAQTQELEIADPEVMQTVLSNLEYSINNAHTLDQVLKAEPANRAVKIEGRSTSLDLAGFFMDEPNSDRRYRGEMFVGPRGGDALNGVVKDLVFREVGGKSKLQIQVDVGFVNEPIICFFNFTDTLEGCTITRLNQESGSTE